MNSKRIKEIRQRYEAATPGPWDSNLETAAGRVWVYAAGSPLAEPLHFLRRCMKGFGLFRIRSDSQPQWNRGETFEAKNDRFWQQKQADADFIAHARTDIPDLLDALATAVTEGD